MIIFGIMVAVMAGLVYMFSGGEKRHNWRETYRPDKVEPYGTSIIYGLLEDYMDGDKMKDIKDSLHVYLSKEETSGSYMYLGPSLWLDSVRISSLLGFVKRGNDAFIFTPYISFELLDSIGHENCIDLTYERDSMDYDAVDYYLEDTLVQLNLTHRELKRDSGYVYNFRYRTKDEIYDWQYIPPDLFCEWQHEFASLGTLNDTLINFAKAEYGDGNFYLHTTPLAFTNYHLVRKEGREYAENVLSHIEKEPILWDKTKRSFAFPRRRMAFNDTPLKYVLSQPPLAWAWYILLGMAVLYLIFRAKRRQRVIPVLEKNENTSLEFINTIGRLYFINNNHRQLALQKMKLFLGFVRERYNMPTKELNDNFKKQLSVKSEIPLSVIEKIFTVHGNIKRSQFSSENTLVGFHREMEGFYMKCK
ncbi:MAG TPA: hypothetical protein ENJ95_23125 [Bacteroidetes bacterium]|nr:hypothetical protein [Bacteroidota bacterium]